MLVAGDMLVFALFFTVYLYYRGQDVTLFDRSQRHLNVDLGVLNTLLLLTSSWFVVLGVEAIRQGLQRRAQTVLRCAIACAIGFVVVKVIEYHEELAAGITLVTDDFFMYYFMFTGIHLVLVVIGLGVLTLLSRKAATATPNDIRLFENGATFWHMVDLLWIMLFALLYLVNG